MPKKNIESKTIFEVNNRIKRVKAKGSKATRLPKRRKAANRIIATGEVGTIDLASPPIIDLSDLVDEQDLPRLSGLDIGQSDPSGYRQCKSIEEVVALGHERDRYVKQKAKASLRRKKVSHESMAIFDAVCHRHAFAGNLSMADATMMEAAFNQIHHHLMKVIGGKAYLVTLIDGGFQTSDHHTEIDLFGMEQAARRTLTAIAPNFIAVPEVLLFNSHTHGKGGRMVSPHLHAIAWHEDPQPTPEVVSLKHGKRFRPNFTSAKPIKVKKMEIDSVNVARVLGYILKAPSQCATYYPGKDGKPGNVHHSREGDRLVRYLRLLQLRSLFMLDEVMFAGGEGVPIVKEAIKFLRALVHKNATLEGAVLHPDQLLLWWSDFFNEVGLRRFKLPFIKTRK